MGADDRRGFQVIAAPSFLIVDYLVQDRIDNEFKTIESHRESVLAIGYPTMPPDQYWNMDEPQPIYLTPTGWICHGMCNEGQSYIDVREVGFNEP